MSTPQNALPSPPRRIPFQVRSYLQYGELAKDWDGIELGVALIFLLLLYFSGSRVLIDRHHSGWKPIESPGTVKSYTPGDTRGNFPVYEYYKLAYTFKDDQGNQHEKYSYNYILFSLQEDESFQKGQTVTIEKYRYANNVYRISKTRAYRNDWRFWKFLVLILCFLWLPVYWTRRKRWFLRNGQTTTARLEKSTEVTKSRQDIYQFAVNDQTLSRTRTVLQPKKEPALEETTAFYDPANPKKSMLLVEISTNLAIEDNRIKLQKLTLHVFGSVLISLLTSAFFVFLALSILAPYLPF